jgi:hypothetical protein
MLHLPTSNTFATQDVGTIWVRPFSMTVSTGGSLPATALAISNSNDDEFPAANDCATTLTSGPVLAVAFDRPPGHPQHDPDDRQLDRR